MKTSESVGIAHVESTWQETAGTEIKATEIRGFSVALFFDIAMQMNWANRLGKPPSLTTVSGNLDLQLPLGLSDVLLEFLKFAALFPLL